MRSDLVRHYDAKYAEESAAGAAFEPSRVATGGVPTDRFQACVATLAPRLRGDVLELGAGDGRIARALLAAGAGCASYTASEASEARLEGLRERLTSGPDADARVRVARLDAEALQDEPGERYDAVLMVALVEHLVDPLAALAEVRRLLRPGGLLYLDTPNVAKWTRRLKLLAGRFPSTASRDEGLTTYAGQPVDLHDEGHLHYFTFRSLERLLLERCGFTGVERCGYATTRLFGAHLDHALARRWPTLFAELCVVARA